MNTHLTQTKPATIDLILFYKLKEWILEVVERKKIHAFIPRFIEKPLVIYFLNHWKTNAWEFETA